MKILVVNGSPKGEYSTTLHSCLYIQKYNPNHQFSFLNVGKDIRKIEIDFSQARQMILDADFLMFSYPAYTFVAPSQLNRFIELMKSSGVDLSGKFASKIAISKHFYDSRPIIT